MTRLLIVLCTACFLTACGSSCEQDGVSTTIVNTPNNPYELSRLSTDLDIVSARWINHTTNMSGSAVVERVNDCVFLLGCGTFTRISASIPLTPGLNMVSFYENEGDCEWKDELQITLN